MLVGGLGCFRLNWQSKRFQKLGIDVGDGSIAGEDVGVAEADASSCLL